MAVSYTLMPETMALLASIVSVLATMVPSCSQFISRCFSSLSGSTTMPKSCFRYVCVPRPLSYNSLWIHLPMFPWSGCGSGAGLGDCVWERSKRI
jgi:hypothetical protein